MLGPHDDVPTRAEIVTYFEDKIVKAVKMWQISDGEAVRSNVVNDFMKEVSDNLTLRLGQQITISAVSHLTMHGTTSYIVDDLQVFRMINPSVLNADRSREFIAVVVDNVLSTGLSQVDKRSIERSVKGCGRESTTDNRYFLKEDIESEVRSLSGHPKSKLRKWRCCTINLSDLEKQTVLNLRQGLR